MGIKVIWFLFGAFVIENSRGASPNKSHLKTYLPREVDHHYNIHYVYDDKPKQRSPSDDGYEQSWKTLRTEKYETKTIDNPHSDNPENKYLVKGILQVREKLPFEDATIGYDKHYQYPLSNEDYESHKREKIVDSENAKNDPFLLVYFDDFPQKKASSVTEKKKKKPQQFGYYYQYPNNDYDFRKNYEVVNSYLKSNNEFETPKRKEKLNEASSGNKPKQYDYSYQYPSDDHEFQNNVKYIDSYISNNKASGSVPLAKETTAKKQKEPKEYHYSYQYPSDDYNFQENVHIVDSYMNKPVAENKSEYDFNDVDDHAKGGYNFDNLGPSSNYEYEKYKTNGPSFESLADYSFAKEKKVPIKN